MTNVQPSGSRSGWMEEPATAYTEAPTHRPESPRPARELPLGADAVLEIKRGPDAGQRFVLAPGKVFVLGRDSRCDIVLPNVTVSRRHAEIRPHSEGFEVADIGSLNGTYRNGRPVDTAVLSHGDELAIGVFRLVYRGGESTGSAGRRNAADLAAAGGSVG
ncbi:MAG TPA: FHA domain-containing protein [Pseudonocardia sp.]|nr:FHA domain-containing protein [Pseudonocardia sp.]